MFAWGSTTLLKEDNHLVFRGKEIRLKKIANHTTIQVTQESFIDEMSEGKLQHGRLNATSLNESEVKDFWSMSGSLQ